jgi:hypothetical protein
MFVRFALLSLLCAVPAKAAEKRVSSNSEMAAIFDADQAERSVEPIDWNVLILADAKRRVRTERLLDSGTLRTGNDFYDAAFVFQHGDTPGDYMKAHLLAMIAMAKGEAKATWIAVATLDRYLLEIGKPQVLGTQFMGPERGKFTQEPYDRKLASDAMREALKVPSLAEQEARRKLFEKQAREAAARKKRE